MRHGRRAAARMMCEPMSNTLPCEHDCSLHCVDACTLQPPVTPPRIDLVDARARCEREAQFGTCDTGRYRMRYYVWGSGPPLLFVHGMSDISRSFLLPIARLSAHFRCIAYDLPFGRGDGARLSRYRHADLVADLWALLDHLGIERSYLLGSSLGSTIALAALHERPGRLPRAILQGGLAHHPLRLRQRLLARVMRFCPGPTRRLPGRERLMRSINHESFARQPEEVWRFYVECSGAPSIASFAYQALMLHQIDLRPLLPQIRQPVLLVCGEHDRLVGPAHQEELLHGLGNAGRAVLLGCGHVPSYTHPEIFAEVVRQFLTPPCQDQPPACGPKSDRCEGGVSLPTA
jgi:pimeloyl-ACP methyl ester carboxylesterase